MSKSGWKLERDAIVNERKAKPCTDCGVSYPHYVMDLDHVSGEKRFDISQGKYVPLGRLLEEIAKCQVVCSNCHRARTWRRAQVKAGWST